MKIFILIRPLRTVFPLSQSVNPPVLHRLCRTGGFVPYRTNCACTQHKALPPYMVPSSSIALSSGVTICFLRLTTPGSTTECSPHSLRNAVYTRFFAPLPT